MTRDIPGFNAAGYLRDALPLFSSGCVNDTLQQQLLLAVEHHILCRREDVPYKQDVRGILEEAKSLRIAMSDCAHRLEKFEFLDKDGAAVRGCKPGDEIAKDLLAAIAAIGEFEDELRSDTFSNHRKSHKDIDKLICTLGGIFHRNEGVSPVAQRSNGQLKLIDNFKELLLVTHRYLPNEEGIRSSNESAFLLRANRHATVLVDARDHAQWIYRH